ncbi:protein of unknown function [Pararobbsia alpina]
MGHIFVPKLMSENACVSALGGTTLRGHRPGCHLTTKSAVPILEIPDGSFLSSEERG